MSLMRQRAMTRYERAWSLRGGSDDPEIPRESFRRLARIAMVELGQRLSPAAAVDAWLNRVFEYREDLNTRYAWDDWHLEKILVASGEYCAELSTQFKEAGNLDAKRVFEDLEQRFRESPDPRTDLQAIRRGDIPKQSETVEPLLTLGSAPLHVNGFRGAVLGQVGESRLATAIEADIAGPMARARALDADTKGPLKDIHRRVGTTIFFESSGGQRERIAHLPELRFALGGPSVDTTSIDSAAMNLEAKAFYIRKVSNDGFRIHHQPTLKKVVNDRKASLDFEKDVRPLMQKVVREQFERNSPIRIEPFPAESVDVDNSPRLQIVVVSPDREWAPTGATREMIRDCTQKRGESARDYPAALVWCVKKAGKELREKAELVLAWRRVQKELQDGTLGT